MTRPRVKICGLTRRADAELAVELGASALGFIFWPRSPRAISAGVALSIHAGLPPFVSRVGVFVNADPAEVAAVVREAALDVVQLHGDENPDDYVSTGARLVKVATLDDDESVAGVEAWPIDITPIVDASDRERRGGTGKVANWTRAARLARTRPLILAGGLDAGNLTTAIHTVRPWGIDVSSGVEDAPGIKSASRMRELFTSLSAMRLEEE